MRNPTEDCQDSVVEGDKPPDLLDPGDEGRRGEDVGMQIDDNCSSGDGMRNGISSLEQETGGLVRESATPVIVGDKQVVPPGQAKLSYAALVAGLGKSDRSGVAVASDFDVVVEEADCVVRRDGDFPSIRFSERVHERIDYGMRQAVIVRLLGRNIGYKTLFSRIKALWALKGSYQLVDLENSYFLVKLQLEEDYNRVLSDGPWTIYGSYLTVQPWSRSFTTSVAHPSQVIVWIRLPGLPYHYYTKSLFKRIAAVIGQVVRVDYNTLEGERGKFARLAVMVDLNKPFLSCVGIDDFVQSIEYEGLNLICFTCGMYGHVKDVCGVSKENGHGKPDQQDIGVDKSAKNRVGGERSEPYGPWMIVTRHRGNYQRAPKVPHDKISRALGSGC
ncbi:hypothetical protein GQ457_16G010640 [Hibiscus cannabinus]